MGIFRRLFRSVLARVAGVSILVFLGSLVIFGLISQSMAAREGRNRFAAQATAAVKTIMAALPEADRTALAAGAGLSPAAQALVRGAVKSNGLSALVFWHNGRSLFETDRSVMGGDRNKFWRAIGNNGGWKTRTILLNGPSDWAMLALATPGSPDNPITVIIPQSAIQSMRGGIITSVVITAVILAIFGLLAGLALWRRLQAALRYLSETADRVANGRVGGEALRFESEDILGSIFKNITNIQSSLGSLITNLTQAAEGVRESAVALAAVARDANEGSEAVSSTMGELTGGITELANNIRTTTERISDMAGQINLSSRAAEAANNLSTEMLTSAQTGLVLVTSAADQVTNLAGQLKDLSGLAGELRAISANIGEVVQVISGVAEQTNLLALNASIEAAHAGEFGVTFTVLAERIQSLATMAAASGAKINKHVGLIIAGVGRVDSLAGGSLESFGQAVDQVRQAGELFSRLGGLSEEVAKRVGEISRAGADLFRQGGEASDRMQNIAAFSEELAASIEEISATAQQQTVTGNELNRNVTDLIRLADGVEVYYSGFKV